MDIIEIIKLESKRRKIPISNIANRLGISQQSLSQMLKSDSIKYSIVIKIFESMGTSLQEVLSQQPSEESKSTLIEIIESQQRTIENLSKK